MLSPENYARQFDPIDLPKEVEEAVREIIKRSYGDGFVAGLKFSVGNIRRALGEKE